MPRLKPTPIPPIPKTDYTVGHAVPRGNKMATYNPKKNTYDKEFNGKNYLIAQGIGNITGTPVEYTRAFAKGFSEAFS